MQPLPIDAFLPEVAEALARHGCLVLTAAPGTGKSTRVPPRVLAGLAEGQQVVLLQPRRVAAISLARRIADEQRWRLGREVGYRVRLDRVGGPLTRLWVETEGTLTRQLLADPYLEGVGAVIIDEFHERSWHADLALSWLAELRRTLRPDLQIVVMSATMAAEPVAAFLQAPICAVPGSQHPVATVQRPPRSPERLVEQACRVTEEALGSPDSGSVLVFLPGVGEIARVADRLRPPDGIAVLPLHGSLPADEQARALRDAGDRRVVLATNVAETSVTVEGVATVVDSGVARVARFDPGRGLDELALEPISRFSAEQRRGRAGRQGPGRCFRLASKLEEQRRAISLAPEIQRCDLAPLVLAVKQLHGDDLASMPWFEAPDAELLQQAEELLHALGFIERVGGALTGLGRLLIDLPVHPRQARLLLEAARLGVPELGSEVAAILSERDLRRFDRGYRAVPAASDLLDRLDLLHQEGNPAADRGAVRQVRRLADRLLRLARQLPRGPEPTQPEALIPALLVAGYPDRVGRRQTPTSDRANLVGGLGVGIGSDSALQATPGRPRQQLLVAPVLQGLRGRAGSRVFVRLAAEIDEADLVRVHGDAAIVEETQLRYHSGREQVVAARVRRFGSLTLAYQEGVAAEPAAVADCLARALAPEAAAIIEADEEAQAFVQRWRWLAGLPATELPPPSPADLIDTVAALCQGERARAPVLAKPKLDWLRSRLTPEQQQLLDRWAPARLPVASGNRLAVDYSGERPVLAVRVQECFGSAETPHLAEGRVPVLLHLLAPNFRPVQVTDDLAGFWQRTYPQVRKDLRGRYPKHAWPEDPLAAAPEAKGGRRG